MQNVSFRNVQEFLEFLPDDELIITEILRNVIFNCIPNVTERLSYNVPFYKLNKGICFIWPAAVLWGTKKSYEGVRLGFNKGYLMQDEIKYLEKGNRKQVYYKDFKTSKDIDIDLLKSYIFEATIIDQQLKNKNNGLQRKVSRPDQGNHFADA